MCVKAVGKAGHVGFMPVILASLGSRLASSSVRLSWLHDTLSQNSEQTKLVASLQLFLGTFNCVLDPSL